MIFICMKTTKNLLRENLHLIQHKPTVEEFVKFAKEYLGITKPCKVVLRSTRDNISTTAYYDVQNHEIHIYSVGRALVDVLRSIAHELTHHKQNLEGRIQNVGEDGSDGSEIENEANSMAGEIMRKYGKIKPEIYTS